MSNKKERRRIVKELLDVTDKEFTDEELIHQLINTELSKDSDKTDKLSFGQRAADAVARFAGSWAFIFSFIAIMVIWMVLNIVLKDKAFDAYPFILLNLVLSCIAAVQAPLIMMSQNRQEEKAGGQFQKSGQVSRCQTLQLRRSRTAGPYRCNDRAGLDGSRRRYSVYRSGGYAWQRQDYADRQAGRSDEGID